MLELSRIGFTTGMESEAMQVEVASTLLSKQRVPISRQIIVQQDQFQAEGCSHAWSGARANFVFVYLFCYFYMFLWFLCMFCDFYLCFANRYHQAPTSYLYWFLTFSNKKQQSLQNMIWDFCPTTRCPRGIRSWLTAILPMSIRLSGKSWWTTSWSPRRVWWTEWKNIKK